MDLLKDITDGLRGDDGRTRRNGGDGTAADDARDRDAAASDRTASSGRSDDAMDRDGDATDGDGETDDSDAESASARGRDDEHVCSFCQTEFDADRRSCPECDAEIVLRGAR